MNKEQYLKILQKYGLNAEDYPYNEYKNMTEVKFDKFCREAPIETFEQYQLRNQCLTPDEIIECDEATYEK